MPHAKSYWLLTTDYLTKALNLGFEIMTLVGYILILAVAVVLILLARVIFFILREEQAVEIELREIEKNSTR
jgi:hypothetical protein